MPIIRHWPILPLLAFFAALYSLTLNSYGMFTWDEAEYASIGRSLTNGHGFAISGEPNELRPPILPLASAVAILLSGDPFDDSALRVASLVFALLAIFCVYAFTSSTHGRETAFAAAALLGISPFFWTFVPRFMTEIPFLAFFASAVWLFYFGIYRHERFFLGSWLCFALALLTRYTAALFFPIAVLFVAIALVGGNLETRRRLLSRLSIVSPLAAMLLLLPWLARQWLVFGTPLASFRKASRQLLLYAPGVSMPWHYYLDRLPSMLSPLLALLVFAGVLYAIWKRNSFALHSILASAFIVVWFSFYRYKEERLISAALPFMVLVAAIPLAKGFARGEAFTRYAAFAAAFALLFTVNFRATRAVFEYERAIGYPTLTDAMLYLRAHAEPGAQVLGASVPQIFWYSGLNVADYPVESAFDDALHRADWLVFTNFERGQRLYVARLAQKIPPASAMWFRDGGFTTVIVRSDVLRRALTSPQ